MGGGAVSSMLHAGGLLFVTYTKRHVLPCKDLNVDKNQKSDSTATTTRYGTITTSYSKRFPT